MLELSCENAKGGTNGLSFNKASLYQRRFPSDKPILVSFETEINLVAYIMTVFFYHEPNGMLLGDLK